MKNILRIIRISKPLYHLVVFLIVLIFITACIELIAPILSKFIVDQIVLQLKTKSGNLQELIKLIGIAFFMSFVGVVLTVITDRIGDHFAGRLRKFLTERFYAKVLSLPQAYFDSELSGKILNQLSRGILTINGFMNMSSNFLLPTLLQSLFTIAIMIRYNGLVGLLTFLLFPIYLSLSHYSTKKWGKEEYKKNSIEDYSRGRIQEVIANIKLVKSFNSEQKEYSIISANLNKSNEIYARQSTNFHIFDFLRNMSLITIIAAINIVVFYNTFNGLLTIGEMVLILQLLNQARRPLFAMSFILTQIQTAESGSKEFFEILDLPSTEPYDQIPRGEHLKNPHIKFKNISFKYETSEQVLKNVSFNLSGNKTYALVGHSGVGKTTIVNLMLKLYLPTSGTIVLNEKKYSEYDHRTIRKNIGLVFQENELFSSTIRENVAYGSNASEKEIVYALKLANAYDFVMKFPNKIDSEIGERGVRLSGGQKQRIQIARAILKNAPILILDEATSSLDSQSEMEVQKGLKNLMNNKLVIIIAHRFSTIQNVDSIIVIDKGIVADFGNPQELSKRKGIYLDLLTYQIEGNKKLLANFDIVS
ncbi:ABC transporter ATP-binding protein [Candidatus Roizmanbacteria bacterium]|nr:ABC transporter ATP-binding protein [Candidatus Roizmanbacteria bacterium]